MIYAVLIKFLVISTGASGTAVSDEHFSSVAECEARRRVVVEQFRVQMDAARPGDWTETESRCGFKFELGGLPA